MPVNKFKRILKRLTYNTFVDGKPADFGRCFSYFTELMDDKNNILTVPNLYLYTYVYLKKIKR